MTGLGERVDTALRAENRGTTTQRLQAIKRRFPHFWGVIPCDMVDGIPTRARAGWTWEP